MPYPVVLQGAEDLAASSSSSNPVPASSHGGVVARGIPRVVSDLKRHSRAQQPTAVVAAAGHQPRRHPLHQPADGLYLMLSWRQKPWNCLEDFWLAVRLLPLPGRGPETASSSLPLASSPSCWLCAQQPLTSEVCHLLTELSFETQSWRLGRVTGCVWPHTSRLLAVLKEQGCGRERAEPLLLRQREEALLASNSGAV